MTDHSHSKDSDCTVDPETLCCAECGVDHSEECPDCHRRGFHSDGCYLSDTAHLVERDEDGNYADKMAESAAEEERAYQAKDRAETRVAEINGEVGDIRRTMHGLFSEIKANRDNAGGAPHLREAVCSQVKAHRSRIKKLIREKLRLEADFWNALPEDCRY